MSVRILTTADLHLGKVSAGSASLGTSGTTREAWLRLVERSVNENVDAIALAGDIVDRDNRFFEAVSALEEGLRKLEKARIPVIMTAGNHDFDVLPELVRRLKHNNLFFLGENGRWETKSLQLKNQTIQFLGWSFPSQYFRDNPLKSLPRKEIDLNAFTLGLVHGDTDIKDSPYAPISMNSFSHPGVQAWVVGHIHKPQTKQEAGPLVYYPGSPQALSAKEQGIHGAVLLEIEGNRIVSQSEIPLSTVRYETIPVDITGSTSDEDIRSLILEACDTFFDNESHQDGCLRLLSFDVILTGTHRDLLQLEKSIENWDADKLTGNYDEITYVIRKVSAQCSPEISDLPRLSKEPSPAGQLAQTILDLQAGKDSDFLRTLRVNTLETIKALNRHTTYRPLQNSRKIELIDESTINGILLGECRRLLSELMQTKTGS